MPTLRKSSDCGLFEMKEACERGEFVLVIKSTLAMVWPVREMRRDQLDGEE